MKGLQVIFANMEKIVKMTRPIIIIVGFILSFIVGYMISTPKCRGVSREVVKLIKKFESKEGDGVLLVIFTKDGKQHYYYSKDLSKTDMLEKLNDKSKN